MPDAPKGQLIDENLPKRHGHGLPAIIRSYTGMATISDFLRAYRVCAKAEGKSPKTIRGTTQAVTYLFDYLGGISDIGAITPDDLRGFITILREKKKWSNHPTNRSDKPLSPFSVASYVRSIKAFWSWLEREGYIKENSLRKVRVPKCPERIIPALSPPELARIAKQIDTSTVAGFRDYTVFVLLLDSGARISEICNLRPDDVNLDGNYIKVLGKGGRERIIPVGNKVSKLLAKWLARYRPANAGEYFFTTIKGNMLTPERIEHAFAQYSVKALGRRIHPHQLQHTCALEWLRGKSDIVHLQRLLGHQQITTTRMYVNLVDDDIRLAHRTFGIVDRLKI